MQLKIRHWDQIRVMPDMVISIIANHWISNSISIWLVMWPFPVKVYDGSVAFSIYFSKIVNREVDNGVAFIHKGLNELERTIVLYSALLFQKLKMQIKFQWNNSENT